MFDNRMIVLLVAALVVALCAGGASADDADNVAGAFSEFGAGARQIGLGGAFVAVADDAYAMVYNPAGLALMDRASATFDYANIYNLGLLKQSYLGGVFPTRWGVHGVSYRGMRVAFDPFPQKLNETTLSYSYAHGFGPFALGTTLKYFDLSSDFHNGTANGLGIDVGARYQISDRWSIGSAIHNLYSNLKFGTGTSESIPTSWRLGTAYRISEKWLVSADYNGISGDAFNRIRAGTEYWIIRPPTMKTARKEDSIFAGVDLNEYPISLAVRSGFDKQQSGSSRLIPSLGATFGYGPVRLDYAFEFKNKGLGSTHRYSLTYDFKPWGDKELEREDQARYASRRPEPAVPDVSPPAASPSPVAAPQARTLPAPGQPAQVSAISGDILVVDFANATGSTDMDWLQIGFADIVAAELKKRGLSVVPRKEAMGTANLAGPAILRQARQYGSRVVVRGLYLRDEAGRMVLSARIIAGDTGRTLDYIEAIGASSDIFSLGGAIAREIAARAGAYL